MNHRLESARNLAARPTRVAVSLERVLAIFLLLDGGGDPAWTIPRVRAPVVHYTVLKDPRVANLFPLKG